MPKKILRTHVYKAERRVTYNKVLNYVLEVLRKIDVRVYTEMTLDRFGEDWCWRSTFVLGCSAEEDVEMKINRLTKLIFTFIIS